MIKQVFFARLVLKRTENVFNKNKKILKYWMPPANYAQLIKKLGVEW